MAPAAPISTGKGTIRPGFRMTQRHTALPKVRAWRNVCISKKRRHLKNDDTRALIRSFRIGAAERIAAIGVNLFESAVHINQQLTMLA
jgi:hypothetical protein